jgi:hypothetical protein
MGSSGDKSEFRIYQGRETAADTGMPDDPDWEFDDSPVPPWLRSAATKIGEAIDEGYFAQFMDCRRVEEMLCEADSLSELDMLGQSLIDLGKKIKNCGVGLCDLVNRDEEPKRLEIPIRGREMGSVQIRSLAGCPYAGYTSTDASVAVVVRDPRDPTVQMIMAAEPGEALVKVKYEGGEPVFYWVRATKEV